MAMEMAMARGCGDEGGDAVVAAVLEAQHTAPVSAVVSRPIMFQLLSSDDDTFSDTDDGGDDAATTMGSPVQQSIPVTPPAQVNEAESGVDSGWMRAKQTANSTQRESARVAPPTRIEDVFANRPRQIEAEVQADEEESDDDTFDSFPPASQQSDVILSPSSQLHILSQISEMASMRAAREREATAAVATSVATVSRPVHAWASAARSQQQDSQQQQPAPAAKKTTTKKRKPPAAPLASAKPRKSTKVISAALATDISTWEAFDEPILAGDDAGGDDWSFDEISDSDF